MAQRVLETERDRELLFRFIEGRKLPITVSISDGGRRSTKQNRLNRLWMNEIAEQMDGWSPEYARAYCKLTLGVPILRAENEVFCERYDAVVKPMPYETKMDLMMEPLDFPVTRLMTVAQQTKYLDGVHRHFSEKGLILTDPGDLLNQYQSDASPASDEGDESPLPPSSPSTLTEADSSHDASEQGGGSPPPEPSSSPVLMEFAGLCYRIVADKEYPTDMDTFMDAVNGFGFKQKSPEEYEKAAHIVDDCKFVIARKLRLEFASRAWAEMLGCSVDDFEKKDAAQ